MKKRIFFLTLLALILILALESFIKAPFTFSSPFGYAGDPAGGGATCRGCHSTGPAVTAKAGWIVTNVPVTGYIPGSTYTITATAIAAGHTKFGFEITPQNSTGTFLGTLAHLGTETELYFDANQPRISHNGTGTSGSGSKTWSFTWTAPPAGSGSVTFYGMFNITNNDQGGAGDTIYSSKTTVAENTVAGVASISAMINGSVSVYPNPVAQEINVSFSLDKANTVEISLLDINGKANELMPLTTLSAGSVTKNLKLAGQYQSGSYFVKLTIGNRSTLHKVVFEGKP